MLFDGDSSMFAPSQRPFCLHTALFAVHRVSVGFPPSSVASLPRHDAFILPPCRRAPQCLLCSGATCCQPISFGSRSHGYLAVSATRTSVLSGRRISRWPYPSFFHRRIVPTPSAVEITVSDASATTCYRLALWCRLGSDLKFRLKSEEANLSF